VCNPSENAGYCLMSSDDGTDRGHDFLSEARSASKGRMGFVNVSDGDEIHFVKRARMLFHVDAVLEEEGSDSIFEIIEESGRRKFKANNQPLIVFFSDNGIKSDQTKPFLSGIL
jgi:hypothetical protein